MRIRLPLLVLMLIVAAPGWAAATYEECEATVEVYREFSNTSEFLANASRFQTMTARATTDSKKNNRGSAKRFINSLIKLII